jgi:hypothetical protein
MRPAARLNARQHGTEPTPKGFSFESSGTAPSR